MFQKIRIVWNLTNACPYHCSYCAAAANCHAYREKFTDKMAILNAILSVERPIQIDFSGGDPLYQASDIEIIKAACAKIDKSSVDISTTGLSLSKLDDNLVKNLADNYSLSYDLARSYSSLEMNGYNALNCTQALRLQELGVKFELFLPIAQGIQVNVEALAHDLANLHPQRIALLRMMSLGKNLSQSTKKPEDEMQNVVRILRSIGYTGKITTSCAYQEQCTALTDHKLGLNQFGDLFNCIWAADLEIPNSKNPFYLGNLTETPLIELLPALEERSKSLNRHICHILDYLSKNPP